MPQDNRTLIAIGAALAVVVAVVAALIFGGSHKPSAPPPASQGGLTVDVADAPALDTTRELRCFVDGQFIGMATLANCARRNGLATDALDVGVDDTGAVIAFTPPPGPPPVSSIDLATLEPDAGATAPTAEPTQPTAQPAAAGSACLRYTGSDWRSLSAGMSLNQCVMALYSGTCVKPGDALYGRWGDTTLRLVPRRVEQSADNNRFRTLTEQNSACQFTGLR